MTSHPTIPASSSLPFFVFDVESVGLHGEAFAVAGGIYINAAAQSEFRFCCPLEEAKGDDGFALVSAVETEALAERAKQQKQ